MDTGVNPEPMGRTAPDYRPSSANARLAMKAGRLAVEAAERGVKEEDIYKILKALAGKAVLLDPDLMCDNPECEECYGDS